MPSVQMRPPVHTTPQAPQFEGSVAVMTQALLHAVVGAAQASTHLPPPQTWRAGHLLLQVPQLRGSLAGSTQTPPHTDCPLGHWHDPATHERPPVQAMPQPPQLASSFEVFTQRCPHSVVPGRHCVAHAPARQS
jgi:hypothetical protein